MKLKVEMYFKSPSEALEVLGKLSDAPMEVKPSALKCLECGEELAGHVHGHYHAKPEQVLHDIIGRFGRRAKTPRVVKAAKSYFKPSIVRGQPSVWEIPPAFARMGYTQNTAWTFGKAQRALFKRGYTAQKAQTMIGAGLGSGKMVLTPDGIHLRLVKVIGQRAERISPLRPDAVKKYSLGQHGPIQNHGITTKTKEIIMNSKWFDTAQVMAALKLYYPDAAPVQIQSAVKNALWKMGKAGTVKRSQVGTMKWDYVG